MVGIASAATVGIGLIQASVSRHIANRVERRITEQNNVKQAYNDGQTARTLQAIQNDLSKVPCLSDPNYGVKWGKMLHQVESLEKRLGNIEEKLNSLK